MNVHNVSLLLLSLKLYTDCVFRLYFIIIYPEFNLITLFLGKVENHNHKISSLRLNCDQIHLFQCRKSAKSVPINGPNYVMEAIDVTDVVDDVIDVDDDVADEAYDVVDVDDDVLDVNDDVAEAAYDVVNVELKT